MGAAESALRDLGGSLRRLPLALGLAADDINGKYRRTILGPLWIMLGQAAMIGGFTLVFSGLLGVSPGDYSLYLAAGLPVWALVSTFLLDMPMAFVNSKGFLESFEVPWLTHIWRRSFGYLLVFAHQIIILFVAMAWLQVSPSANMLYAIPGLLIVLIGGTGLGMLLSVVGARYRDIQYAMSILASFLFFLTPIVWRSRELPLNTWIFEYNPLFYLINVVRDPLLGEVPHADTWVIAAGCALLFFLLGFVSFWLGRGRLYHWL